MYLSRNSFVKRKKVVYKSIGKKTFILNEKNDKFFEPNSTASLIWKNISKPIKTSVLVKILTSKFDVKNQQAEKDLFDILKLLEKKKLVLISNKSKKD